MDFSSTLFRCSAIGHLMTSPQTKEAKQRGDLSEGAKTHLIDVYVANKYGRQTDISNKYIEKGLQVEEDSITLYSRVKKRFYKKNEKHLSNEFIKGTPDLFMGLEVTNADEVIDIKSSWDIYTFFRVHTKEINNLYYYQLQGYMALTGATKARLVYCLVNTPSTIIEDEQRKLFYRMNAGTTENREYMEAAAELEKAMIFDDIPLNERVIEFEVERNEDDIQLMYQKVEKARLYLNNLEIQLNPTSVIVAEYKPNDLITLVS